MRRKGLVWLAAFAGLILGLATTGVALGQGEPLPTVYSGDASYRVPRLHRARRWWPAYRIVASGRATPSRFSRKANTGCWSLGDPKRC